MGDADVGRSIEWHEIKTKSSFQRWKVRSPFRTLPCPFAPTHVHTSLWPEGAAHQTASCPLTM